MDYYDGLIDLRAHPATHRAHRWYRHVCDACGMECPPTVEDCGPELVAQLHTVGTVLPAATSSTPDADASFAAYRMLLRLRGFDVPPSLDALPHHRQTVIRVAAKTLAREAGCRVARTVRVPAPLRERIAERLAG